MNDMNLKKIEFGKIWKDNVLKSCVYIPKKVSPCIDGEEFIDYLVLSTDTKSFHSVDSSCRLKDFLDECSPLEDDTEIKEKLKEQFIEEFKTLKKKYSFIIKSLGLDSRLKIEDLDQLYSGIAYGSMEFKDNNWIVKYFDENGKQIILKEKE